MFGGDITSSTGGTYRVVADIHRREKPRVYRPAPTILKKPPEAVLEPKFDLTLARMASERSLRTFVVWPPVVHLQRDDDDTPTDGYGGNSSRFIEAYLGMDER